MRLRIPGVSFVLLLATGASYAQVVTEMTPERVKEAIAKGQSDPKAKGCYELSAGPLGMKTNVGCFSTPFSRVVQAAKTAKSKYQPFSADDVPAELVAPELHVVALARQKLQGRGPGMNNVQAVVIMPAGTKDRSAAVQPTRITDSSDEYRNALGAVFEGTSKTAVFPLPLLDEKNKIRVVFDEMACVEGGFAKHVNDCGVQFSLKNVR